MEALIQLCKIVPGNLGNRKVIWLQLENSKKYIRELKAIHAKWNAHVNCWFLPDNDQIRTMLNLPQKEPVGEAALAKISAINLVQFNKMKEHLVLKAYSKSTL